MGNLFLPLKKGMLLVAVTAIIAIVASYYYRNRISEAELSLLNEKCAVRAEEYVQKQTGNDVLGTAILLVKHSIYDTKRKSCFTEVNVVVSIIDKNSSYKDFSEVRIYDLLKEKKVTSWIYDGAEQWQKQGLLNSFQEYEKVKKEIFGLGLYE